MTTEIKRLLSFRDVSRLTDISVRHLRRLAARGEIGSVKVGSRRLITARQLAEFIEGLESEQDGDSTVSA